MFGENVPFRESARGEQTLELEFRDGDQFDTFTEMLPLFQDLVASKNFFLDEGIPESRYRVIAATVLKLDIALHQVKGIIEDIGMLARGEITAKEVGFPEFGDGVPSEAFE